MTKVITDKQKELMKKHGLRMVVLFGSQANGEANKKKRL